MRFSYRAVADCIFDRSQYAYERKEAIQKTIMAMTLGKDVSALFPDVLKNIATPDLDQKKLVYLYLMYVFRKHWRHCSDESTGTMQNLIPTYAFLPSTLSSKTPKTLILSSEHWPYEQWDASEWTR